jgi:hypothetical protein
MYVYKCMVRIFDIEFELVMCPPIEESCEEIFCVARPSCCGFSCRFWKPPREGRCCRFLIDNITFIFFRSLAPSHRPPPSASRCLPLLQASKVRHRLQGTCHLYGHRAVGTKHVCSPAFVAGFGNLSLKGRCCWNLYFALLWSFISGSRCLPPPGVHSCSHPRLQPSKVRQTSFSLHMTS